MRTRVIITIFSIVFVFSQCKNSNTDTIKNEKCKQMAMKMSKMLVDYYRVDFERSNVHLDSALALIDTMFQCNCDTRRFNLVKNKVTILCRKKDYSEALKFTQATNDSLFALPYLKYVYLKRIEAIEAQEQNDMETRNKLINDIIIYLKSYMSVSPSEIDSVLALKDINDIIKYEKLMPLIQYYFYRAQIEGSDKIMNELDSLKQNINGNQKFFDDFIKDFVKSDFIPFEGL